MTTVTSQLRPPAARPVRPVRPGGERRAFDGVVCFGGEDWWYHNRGHFDMQMMRRLMAHVPVLYVNSIGMRVPRPGRGRMFCRRIGRKLRSLSRGLVVLGPDFGVLSPFVVPGAAGMRATSALLPGQVRRAAGRMGIARPLLWVACPPAAEVVERLGAAAVVYQRTDRFECFEGVHRERIQAYDLWLKAHADLTVYCSSSLLDDERDDCRRACYVDHGVDYERFSRAGAGDRDEPADVAVLPRPRVGFVGSIDAHTFDPELFNRVASRLDDVQFVLVGPCSLPRGWCRRPNVTMIGQQPYERVPAYMAACDVLIMPWNDSSWITACNPVKLKEYLAVGRPIVSTPFHELSNYPGLVAVARDPGRFAAAVRAALAGPRCCAQRRCRVKDETWERKAATVVRRLAAEGIEPTDGGSRYDRPEGPAVAAGPVDRRAQASPDAPAAVAPPRRVPPDRGDDAAGAVRPRRAAEDDRSAPGAAPLDLAGCLVLAGGLRPSELESASGRSTLELRPTAEATVLDHWVRAVRRLDPALASTPPIRVITGGGRRTSPVPSAADAGVRIEPEPAPFRGPAGVVRDCCRDLDPDRHVLVVEASRLVTVDLRPLVEDHARRRSDVTVATNADGQVAGLCLARADSLRLIPERGFVDLKEQWLRRAVDAGLAVRVHRLPGAGALPLRTREQLIAAASVAAGHRAPASSRGIVRRDACAGVRVICPGALVGPDAVLLDSIVMPGAVIGAGALVVRSVVVGGAEVLPGSRVVDAVVTGRRERSRRRRAA